MSNKINPNATWNEWGKTFQPKPADSPDLKDLQQLCFELLVEVENHTDPAKDILNKRLVEYGYSKLNSMGVLTGATTPIWDKE